MSRRAYLLLPLFLALVSVCYAGIPGNFYNISAGNKEGKVQYLGVEKGRLVLGSPSPRLHQRKEKDTYYDR